MIIGIDIDDTVAKTNEKMIEEAVLFDREQLKGKGFKNRNAYSFMEMFYWSVLDVDAFLKYIRNGKFFSLIEPIDDAVLYINKLKDEGNKIIFITRRKGSFKTKSMTKKWLKTHGFNYDKVYFDGKKKGDIALREGVSLFIDNDVKNVIEVGDLGIESLLMTDKFNKDDEELKRVNNWREVYDLVKEMK